MRLPSIATELFTQPSLNTIETNINGQMTQRGELSGFKAYIDENQEVIKTGMMNVSLQLQPVGYAKYITVNIGFTTEINN